MYLQKQKFLYFCVSQSMSTKNEQNNSANKCTQKVHSALLDYVF